MYFHNRLSIENTAHRALWSVWVMSFLFFTIVACGQEKQVAQHEPLPVAQSLNGKPLYPPKESPASYQHKDSLLRIAESNYQTDSTNLNNIIWYGRRLAYLSRYPEAIDVFSRGLKKHPDSPELLRHRGHRYITTRHFDEAITDLTRAAAQVQGRAIEPEPDGVQNNRNIPLSNLQFNIWYHLGLAYYLKGDYPHAEEAYTACMQYSLNPDLVCATVDWYYMTLMRLGKDKEATALLDIITPDMEVIENQGYYQRLLMYKGLVAPEGLMRFDEITPANELTVVTQGYGVAFYLSMHGQKEKANKILDQILNTSYWPAFGYLAAEADRYRK